MRSNLGLTLLLLLCAATQSNSISLPGKPVLLSCRSPEKETFTCWWKPGSDGGLPTTYQLFYETDKSKFLKPNVPENITVQVMKKEDNPYLHIRWDHPYDTDPKSGWVTIKYELRVQQENSNKWKEYSSGTQTQLSLYNINLGVTYIVQVRCALDHSSWSEWSDPTSVKTPNYPQKIVWTLVSILSAFPVMTAMCILVMKRKYVKKCLLAPVPGPKIRGVDVQLLKRGRTEDIMNALSINQSFPPTVAWKDEIEEYLLVSDDGFLPDPSNSQKRKKSFIIPTGFNLESTSGQGDWDKPEGTKKEIDNMLLLGGQSNMEPPQLPTQKQLCPTAGFVNTENQEGAAENTVQLLSNGSYVDIQRHKNVKEVGAKEMDYSTVKELNGDNTLLLQKDKSSGSMDIQRQEEDIPEDYSRVKEVDSENTVLLQRHNVSIDSSCWENGSHFTDCTSFTGPSKLGVCTELIYSGYVDTIPSPSPSFVSHAVSINK
ncbi:hypothetical protein INR49_017343 [Caranx melampygus]|nr:hypothetical protein INR49_017343 [Caranx melampygus]